MSETNKTKYELRHEALLEALQSRFGDMGCQAELALGEVTLGVPNEHLTEVATRLRDDEALLFDTLVDLCGMDYAGYGESEWDVENVSATGFSRGVVRGPVVPDPDNHDRFAVVYHLLSVAHNQRLRVRVFVDTDEPIIDSVTAIWAGSDWFEREAFDLYGILFSGHNDLRRILTDYGFVGHPFRKDFPLEGHVQMRYDSEQKRVVYEPVDLDPRTLVPRVIREEERPEAAEPELQDTSNA